MSSAEELLADAPLPAFEDAPFAPGQSPFKIKGSGYRSQQKQYDVLVAGGYEAVLSVVPEPMRAFARGHFHASGWYDVLPMIYLDDAAARLSGLGATEFFRRAAAIQAREDYRGFYKLILSVVSPALAITKLTRFSTIYFDFGSARADKVGDRCFRSVVSGVPAMIAPSMAIGSSYYIAAMVERAGASAVSVDFERPVPAGTVHGIPAAEVAWTTTWL